MITANRERRRSGLTWDRHGRTPTNMFLHCITRAVAYPNRIDMKQRDSGLLEDP